MAKSSTAKGVAVLLLVALVSFVAWDNSQQTLETKQRLLVTGTYQTNSTRTNNLQNYCSANTDRTSLVTSEDISTAKNNQETVNSALGIDGNTFIYKFAKGDTGGAMSMITSNVVSLAFFVGAFLVPFIVFLWAWPFLCCCCCCPTCCPSKCCQHPADQPYTKCEMMWPTVTLILALLLVISASTYGFVSASNVGPAFNNLGCSLAIFTDDLLHGNITTNGSSYFTGLTVFKNSLDNLDTNLTTLQTALSDLSISGGGTSNTYLTQIATVQTEVKKIPDNAGTANMNLLYDTPINSAPGGTLQSSFSIILGMFSTNNTLMYKLYYSIEYARLTMQGIKNNSINFNNDVGTIHSQITPMKTTIGNLVSDVITMDNNMGNLLSKISLPGTYGNLGMKAFYGFLIVFSFFSLLGVLLMACCGKPGCRHLVYFTCVFLFIAGLLAFIVAVFFSILVPFFTWTCSFLTVSASSSANFQTNFGAFLSNTTTDQISVCMPYGDGNIVNKVAGNASNGINNLTSVITSLKTFNNATLESYITGNLTALTNAVNSYANGDISDLDTTNNNILAGISDPNNSTNNNSCTSFTDSWVPSNNQITTYSTAIKCKSTSTHTGEVANCGATLNLGPNCDGCMDTTQLLAQYANAGAVSTNVNNRYGGAGCAFGGVLSNLWTNYFNKKYATLGYPASMVSRANTVQDRIKIVKPNIIDTTIPTSVFKSIDNFRALLNGVSTNLGSIQNLTDPTYGMLAGLNCKLFGEDFVTFQNVICGSFYNNMYAIRLTFGIAAWGILFVLCCSVCSGVRHFKQVDKLKKVADMDFKAEFDEGSKLNLRKKGFEKE